MTHILIADQYAIVRQGLRVHLAQPGWEVVAEAANGPDAIKLAAEKMPDVAVLGYALPGLNGIEATRQIRAQVPKTKVLIFTAQHTETLLEEFLEAGAGGCVHKSEPMGRLIEAVRHLTCCDSHIAPPLFGKTRKKPNGSGTHLTGRERAVVRLVADGESNRRIAETLGISLKTVESHRSNAMNKLELYSAADLVRYAVRKGLVIA
jgi:DNA-binding NarL/FixJ family response regulator